jgi:NAD+ synthase (glutamine-hydrolysing)
MQLIKVGVATMNTVPFDWARNMRIAKEVLTEARAKGITVLTLPELWLPDYSGEDDHLRPHFLDKQWQLAEQIALFTRGWGMVFNIDLAMMHEDRLYNCSAICVNGNIVGIVPKRALAEGADYREYHQFKAYPLGKVETVTREGKNYPMGDIYFSLGGTRIAVWKCQEMWEFNTIGERILSRGIKLVMSPNASLFATGKFAKRKQIYSAASALSGAVVLCALSHGCNGKLIMDGGAMICNGGTEPVLVTPRFSFDDYELACTVVDLDINRTGRAGSGSNVANPLAPKPEECVHVNFQFPEVEPEKPAVFSPLEWETSRHVACEEAIRGPALALFDWIRKNRLNGVYISLSGGRDSALCLLLANYMVELAVAELGVNGFRSALCHIKGIDACRNVADFKRVLIKTGYKGTQHSSQETQAAAMALAEFVGAEHFEFKIADLVDHVIRIVEAVLKRKLKWKDADGDNDTVALENVQARLRAVLSWMMANIMRLLLITTSNRSEGCVGYWTAGGDGEGGLAPVSGMSKKFICQVIWYLQSIGLTGFPAVAVLEQVTNVPATAELQPKEMHQTDEGVLGPFDILFEIEVNARLHRRSPKECFVVIHAAYPGYELRQLGSWIDGWFRRWSQNQWKRDQATAGLQTTEFNVDKRGGCDVSICHSGYREELEEMWGYIDEQVKAFTLDTTHRAASNRQR